jgi:uncharacterized protein (DUF2141 family)
MSLFIRSTRPIFQSKRLPRLALSLALIAATLASGSRPAMAADLIVKVSGKDLPAGQIGCALYPGEAGFPMDPSKARMLWLPWQAAGVTCRFTDLAQGRYAVSVMLDQNGNQKVDTNFLGMPLEAWGVSNNARPSLRPPRFNEAAFSLTGALTEIDIKVAP